MWDPVAHRADKRYDAGVRFRPGRPGEDCFQTPPSVPATDVSGATTSRFRSWTFAVIHISGRRSRIVSIPPGACIEESLGVMLGPEGLWA
jgi:hypothetical protein